MRDEGVVLLGVCMSFHMEWETSRQANRLRYLQHNNIVDKVWDLMHNRLD